MAKDLATLRTEIDQIDKAIIDLLEKRMQVTDQVGEYKQKHNVAITLKDREQAQFAKLQSLASHPVLKDEVEQIYQAIINVAKDSMHIHNSPDIPFKKIGIIGLGVMGGGIAKLIKLKNPSIFIGTLKRDSKDNRVAVSQHIIDREFDAMGDLLNEVELLVLASPIDSIMKLAETIHKESTNLSHKLIVIDIASVKHTISDTFERLTNDTIEYVPTHPMAGSDKTGFSNAEANIFIQKPWVICPHDKNTPETIDAINTFIQSCTSRPVTMSATDHDTAVAVVSHLVFILSTYIFAFPFDTYPKALELAGRGFESTTRLASASPAMHQQIIMHNVSNIQNAVQQFIGFLQKNPINHENLLNFFEKYKKGRDEFMSTRE